MMKTDEDSVFLTCISIFLKWNPRKRGIKMIKLTEKLAQNIVDKMMGVVPYNINIMDEKGVIIGSGDRSRLGQLHQGAVTAVREEKLIVIHKSQDGAKPGINMPIYFNETVIGVIGISGKPEEVQPFADIVKVTAELLVEQKYAFNEKRVEERLKEEFLYQWTYNDCYDENLMHMANLNKVDLSINRRAVVIKRSDNDTLRKIKRFLLEDEYAIKLRFDQVLIFMKDNSKVNKRILGICESVDKIIKVGVGLGQEPMAKSVQQAIRAIEISEKLQLDNTICKYNELAFIDIIAANIDGNTFNPLINKLTEEAKGISLIDTLITYIALNGEVNNVANELHIHRNSLNYRLKKIEEITNKNPRNLMDLLELFVACILYKLKRQNK